MGKRKKDLIGQKAVEVIEKSLKSFIILSVFCRSESQSLSLSSLFIESRIHTATLRLWVFSLIWMSSSEVSRGSVDLWEKQQVDLASLARIDGVDAFLYVAMHAFQQLHIYNFTDLHL